MIHRIFNPALLHRKRWHFFNNFFAASGSHGEIYSSNLLNIHIFVSKLANVVRIAFKLKRNQILLLKVKMWHCVQGQWHPFFTSASKKRGSFFVFQKKKKPLGPEIQSICKLQGVLLPFAQGGQTVQLKGKLLMRKISNLMNPDSEPKHRGNS